MSNEPSSDRQSESPSPTPIHLRSHAEIDRLTDLVLLFANEDGATYESIQHQLEALDLSLFPVGESVTIDEPVRQDDHQPRRREPFASLNLLANLEYVEEFYIPVDETGQLKLTENGRRAASALRSSVSDTQEAAYQDALSAYTPQD